MRLKGDYFACHELQMMCGRHERLFLDAMEKLYLTVPRTFLLNNISINVVIYFHDYLNNF